jgi:hypothetical protein
MTLRKTRTSETWPARQRVPVALLEELVKQRLGWADAIVSPFAAAARNASVARPEKPALAPVGRETALRLAG